MPMGCDIGRWTPAGDGKLDDLSPTLQSLAPVPISCHGHHESGVEERVSRHACDVECGVPQRRKGEAGPRARTIISARRSIRLPPSRSAARRCCRLSSCRWTCSRPSGSVTTATRASIRTTSRGRRRRRRSPSEAHPRIVFERLFGEGGSAADRRAALQKRASLLDSVRDDIAVFRTQLGPDDRARVGQYLETVREVERRIQKAEADGERRPRCRISIGPWACRHRTPITRG